MFARVVADSALIFLLWKMADGSLSFSEIVLGLLGSLLITVLASALLGVCEGIYLGLRERLRNV